MPLGMLHFAAPRSWRTQAQPTNHSSRYNAEMQLSSQAAYTETKVENSVLPSTRVQEEKQ